MNMCISDFALTQISLSPVGVGTKIYWLTESFVLQLSRTAILKVLDSMTGSSPVVDLLNCGFESVAPSVCSIITALQMLQGAKLILRVLS